MKTNVVCRVPLAAVCALALSSVSFSLLRAQTTTASAPDRQMRDVLEMHAQLAPKPMEQSSPKEARKAPSIADAVKAVLKKQDKGTAPEPVEDVNNETITGLGGGKIKIRIYTPKGDGPFPVIVYFHGGGWVVADLDVYDATPRALANAVGAVVVSAHYRQAPEHKFPAAHDDTFSAYKWVLENAAKIKGDPTKIAVAGESAGGNMAAAVSIRARDEHIQIPVHQLLIYPVANFGFDTPSYEENANSRPLNREMMKWFFQHYLTLPEDGANPWISLIKPGNNLKGLPPATIITAQIDPLRSEGETLAKMLGEAGVPVEHRNYEGVSHEFFGTGAVVDKAKQAVTDAAQALKKAFGR